MRPTLVGGFVDKTSGTLSAPDLDVNIQWNLDMSHMMHLKLMAYDDGTSGQYTVQVLNTFVHKVLVLCLITTYQVKKKNKK